MNDHLEKALTDRGRTWGEHNAEVLKAVKREISGVFRAGKVYIFSFGTTCGGCFMAKVKDYYYS